MNRTSRRIAFLLALLTPVLMMARVEKDTLYTKSKADKIILTYDVTETGNGSVVKVIGSPRIIPGERLRKEAKGDIERLKVVVFDKVGDSGKVKWKGLNPNAFTIPANVSYERSADGYYILGESGPLSFNLHDSEAHSIRLPIYLALYEKKQNYRILEELGTPLMVTLGKSAAHEKGVKGSKDSNVERIEVRSLEEREGDNEDIVRALSSVRMIKEMLPNEAELPFSQGLQMEIYNLRSMKERVKDPETLELINEVLLKCSEKERELKELQSVEQQNEKAREAAALEQQKQEEIKMREAAEEQARQQEEKQQKRTVWMIIAAAVMGVLLFVGNAVMKHFRDLKNQRTIMEMQQSMVKEAEHEAGRRAREIARNKAHQVANKGKTKLRQKLEGGSEKKTDTKKIRSI